jgi:hypothetical protein
MNKRTLAIIIFIIGVVAIVLGFVIKPNISNKKAGNKEILKYEYRDDYIPLVTYKVELNTKTKEVKMDIHYSCNAVDCDDKIDNYSIVLTSDEYDKIIKIWDDKDTTSIILEAICQNEKVFMTKTNISSEDLEEFETYDKNKDGTVTYREFGDSMLDEAI